MAADPLVVRLVTLEPNVRALRMRLQLRITACVIGGGLALLLGVLGLVGAVIEMDPSRGVVSGLLLTFGVAALWFGVRAVRSVVDRGPDAASRDALPIAFTVADGAVRFPALVGVADEEWPLSETTVRVHTFRGWSSLQLSRSGHRTRRYGDATLASTPAIVAEKMRRLSLSKPASVE